MRSPRPRGTGLVVAACLVSLLLLVTSVASAASTKYPPADAARSFNGGLAGWTASSSFDGNCLMPVLCPSVASSFQATGGADDGGFIRSAYTGVAGATAVGGTTRAVWTSPRFTYARSGGDGPDVVSFEMQRRSNVDQLLAVAGNSATYSVRLVDLSAGGESISLIAPASLAGANDWTSTQTSVDPGRLVAGHEYELLIPSTYVTGTSVLVGGSADYDDVTLRVSDGGAADGGGGDGKRSGRRDAVGDSARELLGLLRESTPGTATLAGKRLLVAVKCPVKLERNCRIGAQGLLRRGKPVSARRNVKVRSGKRKLVALRVRPPFRDRLAKRKRLLVRQKVKVGKTAATLLKSRKLIRRG
jgi:hypothetical protein